MFFCDKDAENNANLRANREKNKHFFFIALQILCKLVDILDDSFDVDAGMLGVVGGLAQNYRTITGKYILSDVMHDYFLKITFVMM